MNTTSMRWRAIALAVALLPFAGMGAALPPNVPESVTVNVPFTPIATVYAEDFELGDGGYVAGGSASWQFGAATPPPVTVPGQGPNMWGTNLAGNYSNSECGYVQSAPVDLTSHVPAPATGVSAARLLFRHWMHVENRYDAGLVMASGDGGATWSVLTPVGGYPDVPLTSARACFGLPTTGRAYTTSVQPADDGWKLAEFDVTAYLGSSVSFRWVFASDPSIVKRGWYVDDVLVQIGAGASATVPIPGFDGTKVPFTPVQTVYAQDFEGDEGGWVASSSTWEWGAPVAPPLTLPGSFNVWGTHLAADYLPGECASVTSPPIDLPGADPGADIQGAQLSMKLWRHTELGFDGAVLQASTDGGATWTRLAANYDGTLTSSFAASTRACLGVTTSDRVWTGPSIAPKEDDWMSVVIDVTSLMGKTIQLRMVFGSDGDTERRGVYFDDVLVQLGAGVEVQPITGPPEAPTAPGWTVTGTNPSWAYGPPTTGPGSAKPVFATNLHGQHSASECSAIVSPAIPTAAIPGLGRLTLAFEHFFDTASTDDGGLIQVSKDDGGTWTTVTPVGGYGGTLGASARACLAPGATSAAGFVNNPTGSEYAGREVLLNAFQGETIRIRFAFGAGPSTHDLGWYIRSVTLTRGAGVVPILAMQPGLQELESKADAILLGQVRAELPSYSVLVTGYPHEGVADRSFGTRAEWMDWFDAQAASFVKGVSKDARLAGGRVVGAWSSAPAVKVEVDLATLALLAQRDDVRSLAADSDDAVRLVEPELAPEGVEVANTEGRRMIQAEEIWALGFRGEGVNVSIIDTGIDATHEAFKNADGSSRVSAWVDFVLDRTTPYDDYGHGTHVAATSLGSADYVDPTHGAFQEVGVAPKARLLVAKFLGSTGSGSFADAIASLEWSFAQGADITSNSWGASGCGSGTHGVMQSVRTLTDAGMLSVFAAGNAGPSSGTIGSPGCSESALTVGAIGGDRVIAFFSSRGPCTDTEIGGSPRICPDLVAKGYLVRSAVPRVGSCSMCSPTGYRVANGTSMATPHVSGAVALIEQMKRAYTGTGWDTPSRAEEEVLKLTALDLGPPGEDNTYGWGLPQLLNVYALLDSTDEARVLSTFGISKPVVRQGDSTTLSFGVRNLGGAIATGDFLVELVAPDATTTTLDSASLALGLLDGRSYTTTLVVTGNVLPGTYTFRGRFDYQWTNGTTGEVVTASILREGTFDVKRVFVAISLDGLDATTFPGDLQQVTFTARNAGNEDASNVTIEFTVADDYVFVPGDNFDPTRMESRYADPAPTSVKEDKNFGRVTLIFNVGTLTQGSSFSFTTNLVPTTPGEYRVLSVAKFRDGGGAAFSQGLVLTQTVGLPSP